MGTLRATTTRTRNGSGAGTREDFRRQARFLADRGLAALIFDKRGSGRSGGNGYCYAELEADASQLRHADTPLPYANGVTVSHAIHEDAFFALTNQKELVS